MNKLIKKSINHSGFLKYFKNTTWLFSDRILRIVVGIFVGIWVARYLGPVQYGKLSYILAFLGLFAPLGKLGFDGIVSRNITKNDNKPDEILSSAALFKFLGSLLIVIVVPGYMYLFKEEKIYFYLSLVLSFVYVIKAFEVIEFFFRAKVKAKYISLANSAGLMASSLLKVFFIIEGYTLIYFTYANLLETVLATILLFFFFSREQAKLSIRKATFRKGFELLQESWPLIIGNFFALVYLNIDQVMIEEMLDSFEVGQYSAAVRISSAWYFIPTTLGWSVQPALVNAKKRGPEIYYRRIQLLFTAMALMAYTLIIPISSYSEWIINLLYGDSFSQAGNVLAIHIMASLFVFLGSARGLWVTNESYFKFALFANIGAGMLNVLLNYHWLPLYGIQGAAWATLLSYAFTYFFSGLFFAPARKIVVMQLKSMLLIDAIYQIHAFANRKT